MHSGWNYLPFKCLFYTQKWCLWSFETNTFDHDYMAKRLNGSRCHLVQSKPRPRPHSVRWGPISLSRVVVSVSTSRSRDGLETYQRLVSVSSRSRLDENCQRLGLVSISAINVSCPRPIFPPNFAGHNNKVNQVNRRC